MHTPDSTDIEIAVNARYRAIHGRIGTIELTEHTPEGARLRANVSVVYGHYSMTTDGDVHFFTNAVVVVRKVPRASAMKTSTEFQRPGTPVSVIIDEPPKTS